MYICKDCGEVFDTPYTETEDPSPSGISLPPGHYTYEFCPHCGGDDIAEAKRCPQCGEWMPEDEDICGDCEMFIDNMIEDDISVMESLYGLDHETAKDIFNERIAQREGW